MLSIVQIQSGDFLRLLLLFRLRVVCLLLLFLFLLLLILFVHLVKNRNEHGVRSTFWTRFFRYCCWAGEGVIREFGDTVTIAQICDVHLNDHNVQERQQQMVHKQ